MKIKWCLNDEPDAVDRFLTIDDEDLRGLSEEEKKDAIQQYIDDYVRMNIAGSLIEIIEK